MPKRTMRWEFQDIAGMLGVQLSAQFTLVTSAYFTSGSRGPYRLPFAGHCSGNAAAHRRSPRLQCKCTALRRKRVTRHCFVRLRSDPVHSVGTAPRRPPHRFGGILAIHSYSPLGIDKSSSFPSNGSVADTDYDTLLTRVNYMRSICK